jgi:protein gp37
MGPCYARTLAERRHPTLALWGPPRETERLLIASWPERVQRLERRAVRLGQPELLFVNDMSDLFESHPQVAPCHAQLWRIIETMPHVIFQLLTKRPMGSVLRMVPETWRSGFPPNVWLGTTTENQTWADRRIPRLLDVPVRVRFLSCEPLLGPLDLGP